MADLDNIIPNSPDNSDSRREGGEARLSNSGGITPKKLDASVDLPSDLKVPIAKAPTNVPISDDNGADELLVKKPSVSSEDMLVDHSPQKSKIPWVWIVGGFFAMLLIVATIYFVSSRLSFNTGTLNLSFDPTGVDVVIDGKFKKQSVSLLTVKLKAGVHTLEVTKDGYLDFERDIDIASKEQKDFDVVLQAIPNLELLVEKPLKFVDLIKSGKKIAYLNEIGNFEVIDLEDRVPLPATVFQEVFSNVQSVAWSPGDPAAIVKMKGTFKLTNMYDNRKVKGRFIPFGKSPEQGLSFNNGISTWLFRDASITADGWRPVLLNESIREVSFSPDGSRIIYFYETADGERSLVVAHSNGDEWERLISQVEVDDPRFSWLNDDRYVLVFDDGNLPDKLFDTVNQELKEIIPDRVKNTVVEDSPDGIRLLYVAEDSGNKKLAVWNIIEGVREFVFEGNARAFTWQDDDTAIVAKDDGSFWYWNLNDKLKPVKFVSALGELLPNKLLYSVLLGKLLIIEDHRVIQLSIN